MSNPPTKPIKHTTCAELARLYREGHWDQLRPLTLEHRVGDMQYGAGARPDLQTVRKEQFEFPDAVIFRYTKRDGAIHIVPKMLEIEGIRHCC